MNAKNLSEKLDDSSIAEISAIFFTLFSAATIFAGLTALVSNNHRKVIIFTGALVLGQWIVSHRLVHRHKRINRHSVVRLWSTYLLLLCFSAFCTAIGMIQTQEGIINNFKRQAAIGEAWQKAANDVATFRRDALIVANSQIEIIGVEKTKLDKIREKLRRLKQLSTDPPPDFEKAQSDIDRVYAELENLYVVLPSEWRAQLDLPHPLPRPIPIKDPIKLLAEEFQNRSSRFWIIAFVSISVDMLPLLILGAIYRPAPSLAERIRDFKITMKRTLEALVPVQYTPYEKKVIYHFDNYQGAASITIAQGEKISDLRETLVVLTSLLSGDLKKDLEIFKFSLGNGTVLSNEQSVLEQVDGEHLHIHFREQWDGKNDEGKKRTA